MRYTRNKLAALFVTLSVITVMLCGCQIDKTEFLSKFLPQNDSTVNESESQVVTSDEVKDDFDKLVDYLINEDSFKYDGDLIKEWQTDGKKDIINDKINTDAGKAYFVQGSIALFNNDCNKAVTYFEKSVSDIPNQNIHLKARCYYELSKTYISLGKYDDSKAVSKKMEALFKNASAKDKEILIELNLWRSLDVLSMPDGVDVSMNIMESTYEIAKEIDSKQMDKVLSELASSCERTGQLLKSTTYKLEAFSIAKDKEDYSMMTSIATDLGISYLTTKNYGQSLDYLKKAYKYSQMLEERDYGEKAYIISNICDAYIEMKAYEKCEEELKFYMELIDNMPEGKTKRDELTKYYLEYARYSFSIDNLDDALKYANMSEERYKEEVSFSYANFDIFIKDLYGDIFFKEGDYDKALEYYLYIKNEFDNRGIPEYDLDNLNDLYETYKALGDHEKAYMYIEARYNSLEKTYRMQESQHSDYLIEQFESEQKEAEILKLQEKNKDLFVVIICGTLLVIIFIVVTIIVFRKNREIRYLNEKFRNLSEIDELTKIYNRRALDEYLKKKWAVLVRARKPVAVAMIDVDFFKKYNDYYGHQDGDIVLKMVASIVKGSIRKEDFVARYGGEEFIIIMPSTDVNMAITVIKRIQVELEKKHIEHKESDVADHVTISVGIAVSKKNESYSQIIKKADDALYEAKKIRNTVYADMMEQVR